MNDNIDNILADELGKVASMASNRRGSLRARLAAKFLPDNEFEITKDIYTNSVDFLAKACDILKNEGRLLPDIETESKNPTIGAIIGSGYMNLNPAFVLICINTIYENRINITIKGIAKEGLIKQHGGEKAVKRIVDKLF